MGNLAKNTSTSLKDVQEVIQRIQNDVEEMSAFVNENTEKLLFQNKALTQTFEGIREMIVILKESLSAINEIHGIYNKQGNVIEQTRDINGEISKAIENENQDFRNIAAMIDVNAQEISNMAVQVETIKTMVSVQLISQSFFSQKDGTGSYRTIAIFTFNCLYTYFWFSPPNMIQYSFLR